MTRVRLDADRAESYFASVFPEGSTKESAARALKDRARARHFYLEGRGNDSQQVKGTLWAAYNGVTELVDHRKPARGGEDVSPARLASVWFGRAASVKERALRVARELMDDLQPA